MKIRYPAFGERGGIRKPILAVLAAILLAGLPAAASAAEGGTERPLRFMSSGTSVVDLATGAYTQDETSFISHLGRSHSVGSGMLIPTGPTTFALSGSYTTTAANGDQLFVSLTGTSTDGVLESVNTITGGTGRFEGASGTFLGTTASTTVSVSATQVTLALSGTSEGTISY